MYADKPDLQNLDRLTWQLIQNGQSKEAARLLLQRYPFSDDENATTQTLMVRLGQLLESLPSLATPLKLASLTQPLSSPALRQLQSQFPGIADNCEAVRNLLGDMSPSYDATAWTRLAQCYRDDFPGLSLYAWQQAQQRKPDDWRHRGVAYQAYQVQDYATALQAWKKSATTH